jgi:lactoylglutathione lyase
MDEKFEHITRVTAEEARQLPDRTDYARLDAMTDEDIARAVAEDPDACPVDADWSNAWLTIPAGIQHRYLSVDDDVVEWFRDEAGDDYRIRMREVLRAHMEAHRKRPEESGAEPRINHVALKVADLEAATRFYENVFGFRQVKTGRSRGHISRHLTDGYVDLALMLYDSENDPEAKLVGPGPAIHHFGVAVADRQAVLDRIRANGGEILSDPDSDPDGGTVKFRAPDGTIAEIADPGRYDKMKGASG